MYYHTKGELQIFRLNCHTLGFHPQHQKLKTAYALYSINATKANRCLIAFSGVRELKR